MSDKNREDILTLIKEHLKRGPKLRKWHDVDVASPLLNNPSAVQTVQTIEKVAVFNGCLAPQQEQQDGRTPWSLPKRTDRYTDSPDGALTTPNLQDSPAVYQGAHCYMYERRVDFMTAEINPARCPLPPQGPPPNCLSSPITDAVRDTAPNITTHVSKLKKPLPPLPSSGEDQSMDTNTCERRSGSFHRNRRRKQAQEECNSWRLSSSQKSEHTIINEPDTQVAVETSQPHNGISPKPQAKNHDARKHRVTYVNDYLSRLFLHQNVSYHDTGSMENLISVEAMNCYENLVQSGVNTQNSAPMHEEMPRYPLIRKRSRSLSGPTSGNNSRVDSLLPYKISGHFAVPNHYTNFSHENDTTNSVVIENIYLNRLKDQYCSSDDILAKLTKVHQEMSASSNHNGHANAE